MKQTFFRTPSEFRSWLEKHHDRSTELWVGFHKSTADTKGITYAEALDEALCFGWIDAVRRSIDKNRWMIRFTPRKRASVWSIVNIKNVKRLTKAGQMNPAGHAAFQRRDKERSKIYSYEVQNAPFTAVYEKRFKANRRAWDFFRAQAPSYQKVARWWIVRAKQDVTRMHRLRLLVEASDHEERLDRFLSKKK